MAESAFRTRQKKHTAADGMVFVVARQRMQRI
jgi:hypothetical protein